MNRSAENWLRRQAQLADREPRPAIDVTERVLETVSHVYQPAVALDTTSLLLGAGLVGVAASIMAGLLPSLLTMTEPWISFWLI